MDETKKRLIESLGPDRGDIQFRVNRYFGTDIEVEERALQSMEFTALDPRFRVNVLWKNALLFYPALACIIQNSFSHAGDYEELVRFLANIPSAKFMAQDNRRGYHNRFLKNIFVNPLYKRGLNELGKRIRNNGKLGLVDLLVASLQKGISYQDMNPVVNAIYKRAKTESSGNFAAGRNAAELFRNELITSFARIKEIDESVGGQQFVIYSEKNKIRILPTSTWNSSYYQIKGEGDIHLQRENVVQANLAFGFNSLEQLEYLINSNARESEFQAFFSKNPQYLTSLGSYSRIHPQLILHEDDGTDKIPDFFLERFDSSFCDICELKKPSQALTKDIYNLRAFRDRINIAIQQVSNYRDYFEDRQNREKFHASYGLKAFKPRVILVVGRKNDFYDDLDRIRLEDRISHNNVQIFTYDDIVANARRWMKFIRGTNPGNPGA